MPRRDRVVVPVDAEQVERVRARRGRCRARRRATRGRDRGRVGELGEGRKCDLRLAEPVDRVGQGLGGEVSLQVQAFHGHQQPPGRCFDRRDSSFGKRRAFRVGAVGGFPASTTFRAVAAPVQRDQELELTVDSLAYGGNGVARLDGFVVFVRRGLPGDTVRARVTKVQRRHAEAIATEVLVPGPAAGRRAVRALSRPAAAAASRISPTTSQVATKEQWVARLAPAARRASPTRRSSRSCPPRRSSATATRWSTRSRSARTGRRSACTEPGRWDEVLEIEELLADDRRSATRSATGCATGRARSGSRPTTRRRRRATSATSSSARAATPARRSCSSSPPRGERFDRERLIEVLTEFPEVRSIHWSVNTRRRRGDEPADRAALGRGRDRGADRRAAVPRPPERVPADEHRDGRAALRARARVRRTHRRPRRSTTCTAGSARSGSRWPREALTVWGIEISEESVACAIENAGAELDRQRRLLRRQRRRGAPRAARARRATRTS